MDIAGLIKYFHLDDIVEKQIELYDFNIDRLELSALLLLDKAQARGLPYAQAIELCRICKNCLGLEGGVSNPFAGKKNQFGRVLAKAALELQTNVQPLNQVQIKNINKLTAYHPLVQSLEAHANCTTPTEMDLRALIQLAVVIDYDHQNLAALFTKTFAGIEIFKSAFENS